MLLALQIRSEQYGSGVEYIEEILSEVKVIASSSNRNYWFIKYLSILFRFSFLMSNYNRYYKKENKSDDSGCYLSLMILGSIIFGIYHFLLNIISSYRLSDILFGGLIAFGCVVVLIKVYIKNKKLKFESKKCIHGVSGGETLTKCEQCNEEKKNQLLEKERIEKEKHLVSAIQIDSRTIERVYLEKLESLRNSSLDQLRNVDPFEFEKIVGKLFQKLGYKVFQTPKSNDKGKDLILTKKGQKFLVECKRYAESKMVGRPELQKFYAAIIEEEAEFGYFVTSSDFASTSKSYINDIDHKIKLINGTELIDLMKSNFPNKGEDELFELKCRVCGENVEFGFPFESVVHCSKDHRIITSEKSIRTRLLKEQPQVAPECPKCHATMERRRSKRFKSLFWGCSNYPNCYGKLPYKF